MKKLKLLSIYVSILFTSFQLNAQVETYFVSTSSDILSLNAADSSIIRTAVGGEYFVRKDSIDGFKTDSCAVVKTFNGNYAILQTRNGGFYIEDFGAIPNDNQDDSKSIQKCIDAAIQLDNTSKVNAGPGQFDLDKGVVIANPLDDDQYNLVTMTLSGNIPSYGSSQTYGSTTVFKLRDSTFCIAIQRGRNCMVENIAFIGNAKYDGLKDKDIIEFKDRDWGVDSDARTNRFSPSCAIAIDPFHKNVSLSNRYPNHNDKYFNVGAAGTSMLTIKSCSFRNHYIAIANNPSNGAQNGDNIRAENCYVRSCNTFWAAGQSQSRGNSINNVYSLLVRAFIDCSLIGKLKGTSPTVSNCNLAGFTKELFVDGSGGLSVMRVNNTYIESIFSLGYAATNNVTFQECQIKFHKPSSTEKDIFTPPYHLWSRGVASFIGCSIEFFDNCDTKQPFIFKADGVEIIGGHIEGGLILNGGFTNAGGEKMHEVNIQNTGVKCSMNDVINATDKVAGNRISGGTYLTSMHQSILMGGDELQVDMGNGGSTTFKNEGPTYNVWYLGTYQVDVDSVNKIATIVVDDPGKFQVGDNILHSTVLIDPSSIGMKGTPFRGALGVVDGIAGDTIIVTGVPYGFPEGSMSLYSADYPRFYMPIWGDFTTGNDTIKNIVGHPTNSQSHYPRVGSRIFNTAIPEGAYVKAIDRISRTIVLSMPATRTSTYSYLYNAHCSQKVEYARTVSPSSGNSKLVYIEGARIYMVPNPGVSNTAGYIVVKGGYPANSSHLPQLEVIAW